MDILVASDIEILVYQWLSRKGIAFDFQTSFSGGHYQLGGSVVDFIIEPDLAWRVMGEHWHEGVEKTGSDIIQKEQLVAMGYRVVDLWESDLKERLDETLNLALQGMEALR